MTARLNSGSKKDDICELPFSCVIPVLLYAMKRENRRRLAAAGKIAGPPE